MLFRSVQTKAEWRMRSTEASQSSTKQKPSTTTTTTLPPPRCESRNITTKLKQGQKRVEVDLGHGHSLVLEEGSHIYRQTIGLQQCEITVTVLRAGETFRSVKRKKTSSLFMTFTNKMVATPPSFGLYLYLIYRSSSSDKAASM